ncbi:MAG: hypothetical protein HKL96_09020 [Phycisphaerales bacterium]|nr:hypothetical protein [Phycisphaerales bacterium]
MQVAPVVGQTKYLDKAYRRKACKANGHDKKTTPSPRRLHVDLRQQGFEQLLGITGAKLASTSQAPVILAFLFVVIDSRPAGVSG